MINVSKRFKLDRRGSRFWNRFVGDFSNFFFEFFKVIYIFLREELGLFKIRV